jgi:hypothetical protein
MAGEVKRHRPNPEKQGFALCALEIERHAGIDAML